MKKRTTPLFKVYKVVSPSLFGLSSRVLIKGHSNVQTQIQPIGEKSSCSPHCCVSLVITVEDYIGSENFRGCLISKILSVSQPEPVPVVLRVAPPKASALRHCQRIDVYLYASWMSFSRTRIGCFFFSTSSSPTTNVFTSLILPINT